MSQTLPLCQGLKISSRKKREGKPNQPSPKKREGGAIAPPSIQICEEVTRSCLKRKGLCLAQDASYFGAALWADALCETTTICFFNVSGEFTLGFALHAICLAGVAFGHGALLLTLSAMRSVAVATS